MAAVLKERTPPSVFNSFRRLDQFIFGMDLDDPLAMTGGLAQFFPNNVHRARRLDADSNRIRPDSDDRHRHVFTDQNLLTGLSGQSQPKTLLY